MNLIILQAIISDEQIEQVHANSSFGNMSKRDVVKYGLLKCASGFYQGSTSKAIIREHGLIGKNYTLTKKGKKYLWNAFNEAFSI